MSWEPGDLLKLETERFIVRSITREDVDDEILSWLANPEIAIGLNMAPRKMTRQHAVMWALNHDNIKNFCVLVIERASGQKIGFFTISLVPTHNTAETAVVIGSRAHWGQDVVIEARSILIDFLFDTMRLHKVLGRPHSRNFSSIYNYKALGFTCEAVLREQMRAVDGGERLDQLVFGILATEWHDRRAKQEAQS